MASSTDITPKPTFGLDEQGYRARNRVQAESTSTFSSPNTARDQEWPVPKDERTLSPAEQSRLEIRFGVIIPDPPAAPAANPRSKDQEERARETHRSSSPSTSQPVARPLSSERSTEFLGMDHGHQDVRARNTPDGQVVVP